MDGVCDLCLLKRKTNVYIDNEYFIIMDCDSCHVPMIVWKEHTMDVPDPDKQMMETFLTEVANQFYEGKGYFIDKNQRDILDHIHWHARSEQDWKDLNF
jgi:hypothetical protein